MPKLPLVLAGEPVAAPRGVRMPNYGGGAEAAAIAQAGASIANTLFDFAALEQKKQAIAVRGEVEALEAEAERRLAVGDNDLRLVERDPDAYRAASDKLTETVAGEVRQTAKYAEAASGFDARMARVKARYQADAYKHVNGLYLERDAGQLGETLDTRRQLAGVAMDDEDWRQHHQAGLAAIEARRPLRGDAWVQVTKEKFTEEVLLARAEREKNTDPADFLKDADARYFDLDPKQREELKEQATAKVKEIAREAVNRREKAEATAEKITEKNRQWKLSGLSLAASKRELTRQQVIDAREEGLIVNATEVEHFMTLATKGTAIESDPATWSAVQADVWGERPTYTESRIRALMARAVNGDVGLSGEHGRMALTELNRKREQGISQGTTEEHERRRLANDAYNKAKEEGLMGLGITTPLSQLDKTDAKLAYDFVREFNARVLDPSGNVRTDVQMRQMLTDTLPAFLGRKSSDTRLTYQKQAEIVRDLTGSQVPDVMDPAFLGWYSKQVKDAEALGADPKTLNLYTLRRDQLLGLSRARNEFLQAEARKAAAASGGKTGGYRPPGEGSN